MYNILDYAEMMADQERVKAYAEALQRVLDDDSIVLDIGTGAGIFALLAGVPRLERRMAILL